MKKTIFGCLGAAAVAFALHFTMAHVQAGLFSSCNPCDEVACNPCDEATCDPCDAACGPRAGQWNFGGWIEAGFYANQYGRRNIYSNYEFAGKHNLVLPLDNAVANNAYPGNYRRLNNVALSDPQMNQAWIFVERTLNTRRGLNFGGRVDFLYGTDGRFTQSDGLEFRSLSDSWAVRRENSWGQGDYFASFAQIYGEVGFNNVSVKAGKFLSPMGSNSIMSPERFFYSLTHAFAAMPVTHTGVIGTWSPSKNFSAFGGWVNGEDRTFYNNDGTEGADNAALFGVEYALNKRVNLAYTALIGKSKNGAGRTEFDVDYFVHSFVVNAKLNKRWDYTFEWTLRNEKENRDPAYRYCGGAYGINQELVYRLNSRWAVGGRAEWMHLYGNYGDYFGEGFYGAPDIYAVVFGANWTPNKWLTVKPEVRYDWTDPKEATVFDNYTRHKQFSGGVSAIVKF